MNGDARPAASMLVAWLLDARVGEPPAHLHPVRGMGRLLDALAERVPPGPPRRAVVRGGTAWATGLVGVCVLGWLLERGVRRLPPVPAALLRGVALWPLVSLRMLVDEVERVERELGRDLDAGRAAVACLVSREVGALDAAGVREAALSSLAENVVDSWVAPLAWFTVAGLPGAFAYRYVNTADSMWGHRDPRWRHSGAIAARADDAANLLPARVTGWMLAGREVSMSALRSEARGTPSPNGGWPMGALALRLGIRLSKPGVYVLNPSGRSPRARDTAAAVRVVRSIAAALAGSIVGIRALAAPGGGRACRH